MEGVPPEELTNVLLPVVRTRGGRSVPPSAEPPRKGDEMTFVIFQPKREQAAAWLKQAGWEPAAAPVEKDAAAAG